MSRTGKVSVLTAETDSRYTSEQARKYQISASWKIKPGDKRVPEALFLLPPRIFTEPSLDLTLVSQRGFAPGVGVGGISRVNN